MSLSELLDAVAKFAEAAYPGFEYATVVIHHGPGITDTVLVAFPSEIRSLSIPEVVPSAS